MMEEMETRAGEIEEMTPAQLGGEIRLLTSQARRMALSYAIQIGYRLKIAHDKVGPHGWAEWLKAETDFSQAAASRLQALYEGYGEDQGSLFGVGNKFPTLEKISVSNALRLLAVPEEEREQVAAEVDAEHISARELERALAERDEARRMLEDAERRAAEGVGPYKEKLAAAEKAAKVAEEDRDAAEKAAEEMADKNDELIAERDELSRRVKELESRPVEVAVERDEAAIQEAADAARKAAEDAAKKELDKLRAKLDKAEKAKEKAEAEAKRAAEGVGPYKEKIAAAEAEAEQLRKKLLSAESGAGEVAMLARQAQVNFAAAMDKIEAMREQFPGPAEAMLAGMTRIAESLANRIKAVRG